MNFVPILLVIAIFYFLLFKPEKDKQKKHKERVDSLKTYDKVVTAGGIHGTVVDIKDTTLIIRVDDNVRVEVDKDAISVIKDNKK